jgi:CHAT domain-containing protein/Tfp pilus assembly protein PilF
VFLFPALIVTLIALMSQHTYASAGTNLDKIAAPSVSSADRYYGLAKRKEEAGEYSAAGDLYAKSAAFALESEASSTEDIAAALMMAALSYNQAYQDSQALHYAEQAIGYVKKMGSADGVATLEVMIGSITHDHGQYERALQSFHAALKIYQELGNTTEVELTTDFIARVHYSRGDYGKAREGFEAALEISRQTGSPNRIAAVLGNLGRLEQQSGRFDEAIELFSEGMDLYIEIGDKVGIASGHTGLGDILEEWGRTEDALVHYEQAIHVYRKLNRQRDVSDILFSMGEAYRADGLIDSAINRYHEAMDIEMELQRPASIASLSAGIGACWATTDSLHIAQFWLENALKYDRQLGREASIATDLSNIGALSALRGQYAAALDYFSEALAMDERLGNIPSKVRVLSNIAHTYADMGRYPQAISEYERAVDILEHLRKTAPGSFRLDYLDRQLFVYQNLLQCYLSNGQTAEAFKTIEVSRAKWLAERLRSSDLETEPPSVQQVIAELPSDTALLIYASTSLFGEQVALIVLTSEGIESFETPIRFFTQTDTGRSDPSSEIQAHRGLKKASQMGTQSSEELVEMSELSDAVGAFRALLGVNSDGEAATLERMGKELYTLLLEPADQVLHNKENLIIVPDGILAMLPFETLIDGSGRYLAQTHQLSYEHSVGVLRHLEGRLPLPGRKRLLAVGGAIYSQEPTGQQRFPQNPRASIRAAARGGQSVSRVYDSFGMEWTPLPGTLREVLSIAELKEDVDLLTGIRATETEIKRLSTSGELSKYNVIHFATHGFAVPEAPELSALVLSQLQDQTEDGYLQTEEIAQLDISADFVNLSACESGLGRLYGGEGVVGLVQAFLIAGANGLSVSLWQVSDESTALFMETLYEATESGGKSYNEAMGQTKRRFIRGDFGEAYTAPYYWAPFVYYGL